MNVLAGYLCVVSLVGAWITKGEHFKPHLNENESIDGWDKMFGRISDERISDDNETDEFPIDLNNTRSNISSVHFGLDHQYAGNASNDKIDDIGEYESRRNKTGIPAELFIRWWSVVRPFGNEMVTKPKFPWSVAVEGKRPAWNVHLCSGNILTKLYVLTTCRCLSNPTGSAVVPLVPKDPTYISIIAGLSMLNIPLKEQLMYGQIRDAVGVSIHPQCTLSQRYDYGVVELEYYLYYTDRVLPIPNPFETFRGKISSTGLMKDNEICQSAGWRHTFWEDESKGEQFKYNFLISENGSCSTRSLYDGIQFVCTRVLDGDRWKSSQLTYSHADIGGGLLCQNRVTAIMSQYSGENVVFSSLRPALSFLWQYYEDPSEMYTISSSQQPAVCELLLISTFMILFFPAHL